MSRKTCNGCKSLYIEQCGHAHCDLGYKIVSKVKSQFMGVDIRAYYPEDTSCPKPKTNKELSERHLEKYSPLTKNRGYAILCRS